MPLTPRGEPVTLVSQVDPLTGALSGSQTPQTYALLTAATANGNGTPATNVRGGDYNWTVDGVPGGATVTLQRLSLDGSTWVNVRNAADTADVTRTTSGSTGVSVGQGASIRAVVSNATGTTNLYSAIAGLN